MSFFREFHSFVSSFKTINIVTFSALFWLNWPVYVLTSHLLLKLFSWWMLSAARQTNMLCILLVWLDGNEISLSVNQQSFSCMWRWKKNSDCLTTKTPIFGCCVFFGCQRRSCSILTRIAFSRSLTLPVSVSTTWMTLITVHIRHTWISVSWIHPLPLYVFSSFTR